jgi:hypothetical protein
VPIAITGSVVAPDRSTPVVGGYRLLLLLLCHAFFSPERALALGDGITVRLAAAYEGLSLLLKR